MNNCNNQSKNKNFHKPVIKLIKKKTNEETQTFSSSNAISNKIKYNSNVITKSNDIGQKRPLPIVIKPTKNSNNIIGNATSPAKEHNREQKELHYSNTTIINSQISKKVAVSVNEKLPSIEDLKIQLLNCQNEIRKLKKVKVYLIYILGNS